MARLRRSLSCAFFFSATRKSGVSGGVIAGAIIASLAGTAILLGLLYLFLNRRKKSTFSDWTPRHNDLLDASGDATQIMREAQTKTPLLFNENSEPGASQGGHVHNTGFTSGSSGVGSDDFTSTPTYALPTNSSAPPSRSPVSPPSASSPAVLRSGEKGCQIILQPPQSQEQQSSPSGALPDSTDEFAVDRIANVVAERIAQRFGCLSGEDLLSPPPEYGDDI